MTSYGMVRMCLVFRSSNITLFNQGHLEKVKDIALAFMFWNFHVPYKQKVIFLNIKSRWLTLSKYCILLQIFTNCIWKCQGHARVRFECFDLPFVIQGLLKSCTHWYVADPKPHCKVSLCCCLKLRVCFLFAHLTC